MAKLANYKDKKVILHTYNKSSIPQLGVYRVNIMHKDKQKPCRFFAVPGGQPLLLGMPDVEKLELLKCELQHNRAKTE